MPAVQSNREPYEFLDAVQRVAIRPKERSEDFQVDLLKMRSRERRNQRDTAPKQPGTLDQSDAKTT